MKTNIKFLAIIAVLVIGFFLPFVLVDDRNCCWYRLRDWCMFRFNCCVSRLRKTCNRSRGR